jgi:hypothetical protein
MSFILKNTSGLVNTRLTDTGRLKLSQGNFNISYFQIGDSEVSYTLSDTSYNQYDTNILEPNFNSQNSAGYPQNNKQYVKYPYYVDGISGNTYGIPFLSSEISPVYNRAVLRGFFTGNTTADTINWSAFTNSQYTINSNYVVNLSTLTGGTTIDIIYSGCNTDITRLPSIGDLITIFYDGNSNNCNCTNLPVPTPTPTSSSIPQTYISYWVTDCCGTKPGGHMLLPNTFSMFDVVGSTTSNCYMVSYPENQTPTLIWDGNTFGSNNCESCYNTYVCDPTPSPTASQGFPCNTPNPTPTPSATHCTTPLPYYCPPPPPANCEMDVNSCYSILTYKIVGICGLTFTLDRPTPNFSMFSDCCTARMLIYPPNMTSLYDSITPAPHWDEDVINFESVCDVDQFDVKVWNMNIPWTENPAGLWSSISKDYHSFGSLSYIGAKEYFGYMSNSGQTDTSLVYYKNSFDEIIQVYPKEQKSIAIIHYTNQSIDFFYGEKFAFEHYDTANPTNTTGQARNFKLHFPTLMWHKNPECCFGQTFWVDPPGFDSYTRQGSPLFQVHYLKSKKNPDMNNPNTGMRYYHLWDTNKGVDGYPNRIGKVFPDQKLIVIDDDEIIAAMSYKSNRNWTLPAPKLGLITPNTCGTNNESPIGLLTDATEFLYVTYRFTNSNSFTNSLHCNYYSKIQGPDLTCLGTSSQNVSIRFGDEFPCLNQPNFSVGTICVKILNECGPHSECPSYYDAVPSGEINGKNSYSVAGFEIFWNSELNRWESWLSDEPWGYLDNTGEYPIGVWSTVNPGTYPIFYETNLGECNISCNLTSGFFGEKLELIFQKVSGDSRPDSTEWKIMDVTNQITGNINGYITSSGITNSTFVITEQDYTGATKYFLNQYIDLTPANYSGTSLNFGDEYYFYGSIETDIQATIYEMKYKINLGQSEYQSTSNPSWVSTSPKYISEIGLYDSDMNLMIISKLQSPVLRQGIQQFLVKFDF